MLTGLSSKVRKFAGLHKPKLTRTLYDRMQ